MTTRLKKQEKMYEIEQEKKRNIPLWDKKSIVGVILIFCFLVFLIFISTTDIKEYLIKKDTDWCTTTGQIQSIEEIIGMNQTRIGNRLTTVGYKVKYNYIVDDTKYEKIITYGSATISKFINTVEVPDSIEVYYKKEKPNNSHINKLRQKTAIYKQGR